MERILHSYKKYLFCFLYGLCIIIINNLIVSSFSSLIAYADGAFIAGLSLFCFGGLSIVGHFGAFDIFTYLFDKKNERGVKRSFYDYCEGKKEVRSKKKYGSIPYFLVGFFYVLLSLIFVLVINFS